MKKSLLFSTVFVLLTACAGVKKTQKALNSGNYTTVMNKAVKALTNNKTKKANQRYVLLLEDAFARNSEKLTERIAFLEKDNNPANLEAIYNAFLQLKQTQNRIRPLLPLAVYDDNRDAVFNFKNYDARILKTKTQLSDYLYANATNLLDNASNKFDFRQAYDDLKYLDDINPGYKNTNVMMDEAYQKGLDYVKIELRNDTQQIIPEQLEKELLDFNTYGINNFWTQFHTDPVKDLKYDYAMNLDFREINISPEQISEKQIIKEKQIRDGYKYVYDDNGNVAKDSLGNDIKVENFKIVTCDFYQFTQFKSAQIGAKVSFTDLHNGQEINSYPISSEFIFEHLYANYSGDKRALDNNLVALLDLAAVDFPSNEQMVFDAGEDLKARIKNVVQRHSFN